MDYNEICHRIQVQIRHYEDKYGMHPNRIILGMEIYLFLTANENQIVKRGNLDNPTTIFSIQIARSWTNPHEISVGYVEEIGV
jgi:hypothetical protein